MNLVIGQRYLCGMPWSPTAVATIVYLGPVGIPGWKNWSRVQNFITGKIIWVRTEAIRPLLVSLRPGEVRDIPVIGEPHGGDGNEEG